MIQRPLRYGALFAGYGGLEDGVQSVLGGELAWYSEYEPPAEKNPRPSQAAARIMAYHHPGVPNLGDITQIDWHKVAPVDVLTGGYPCQPFSLAGRRAGTDDGRHLWPYVADAISVLRPKLCVFENVRGHLSLGMDTVLKDLHRLGYVATWLILRASDIGAPHGRARLFIFAEDGEHDTGVCGWLDRWRGVDWDQPCGGCEYLCDSRAGCYGHQGVTHPHADAEGFRWSHLTSSTRVRAECAEGCLGGRWQGGEPVSLADPAASATQDGASGLRTRAVGGDRGESARARPDALERCIAAPRALPDVAITGVQPERTKGTRPQNAVNPPGGNLSLGRMVVPGGGLVRTRAFLGKNPNERPYEIRSHLRASDVGAPHGRYRVFVFATPADTEDVGHERGRGARPGRTGPENGGDAPADADSDGLARLGRVDTGERDTDGRGREDPSRDDAEPTAWGPYAPAIDRWAAALGRPAPTPTELGPKCAPRLSPRFVEWLMGLPAGHVTDVPGISRNDQLKALGNGVVPAQAAEAVRRWLAWRAAESD